MNQELVYLIDRVKAECLAGKVQERDAIITLLGIAPGSPEYTYLCQAAREAAMTITKKEAYLWGAIGVDFAPCSMNCTFCSLGEAWGIVDKEVSYSEEEIITQIRQYVSCGVRFIVLRTTEFYSIDTLCQFIRNIRAQVAGEYELVLNIGEFDVATAQKIYESGVSGIYHALRLGEGRDTAFDPAQRNDTLGSVHHSPLKLIHLIEPVGVEHTNEEIADVFLNSLDYGVVISGAMARIPVKGTPLGENPQVSDQRLAQIVAVTRLCGGKNVPDICVHPPSEEAVMAGANVVVVERGAVPRDGNVAEELWNGFDCAKAKELLCQCGYEVVQKKTD